MMPPSIRWRPWIHCDTAKHDAGACSTVGDGTASRWRSRIPTYDQRERNWLARVDIRSLRATAKATAGHPRNVTYQLPDGYICQWHCTSILAKRAVAALPGDKTLCQDEGALAATCCSRGALRLCSAPRQCLDIAA